MDARSLHPRAAAIAIALLLVLSVALNIRLGAVPIGWGDFGTLFGAPDASGARMVIMEIRLPRLLATLAVGAGLGVAGACLQGLFRNPLAEPSLLGVSVGAALGAALWFLFGASMIGSADALRPFALPLLGFSGALIAVMAVLALGRRAGPGGTVLMLLLGIGINAIGGAMIGLATYISTDMQLRSLALWMLGSFAQTEWPVLLPVLVLVTGATLLMLRRHRELDLLSLGEDAAGTLGLDAKRLRLELGLLTAVAVGAGVAVAGIIGFVGLIVPHIVRLTVGPGHRALLPLSAAGGALLVSFADLAARLVALPAEAPAGVVMALVGAPVFIALLLRGREWRT